MGLNKKSFLLPNLGHLLKGTDVDQEKIVIVSIIGKSPWNSCGLKARSLGQVFVAGVENTEKEVMIEGMYEEKKQIVYLHSQALFDTDILISQYDNLLEQCRKEDKGDDFLIVNDQVKSNFARTMLLLIRISHIVVVSQPGTSFDTSYIQLFKAIDGLNQKLYTKMNDSLKTIEGLNPEWVHNVRFCTARFIFYFERCPKSVENIKKLEHNLEDKIYHILKKSHILMSSFRSSLFAIPMNEEFVFMSTEGLLDRFGDAVRGLIEDCQPGGVMQVEAPFSSEPYSDRSFVKFLQVHIQQAKTQGFNDSSSRQQLSQPAYFELPTLKKWVETSQLLYGIIINSGPVGFLCTDTRFSEQRCLKVLPLAVARYQENLPSHYSYEEHEKRLANALALFSAQARGSVFDNYVRKLQVECRTYWENGRQQCEALSMTGNPCKLPKHLSDQEHKSAFVFKAACDCGRKIGVRDDPYNAKQANWLYYQQLSKECACLKLERISFPIFQPSIKEFKAATLTEENFFVLSDRSNSKSCDTDRNKSRQPSTTEYLPGMLTLTSPAGLLPVFSSWSLVCLGPSSLYSHNLGLSELHHPGFLNSTNYLLPWDVTVYSKVKSNWPHVGKFASRGRRGRSTTASTPSTSSQFSVKVFIGIEYECTSGHRFMLAAPDKMLKATPGSIVKDTGHKIAESDMPLYYPCICRPNKLAQLMRLHVVTPKAPVHCTLEPKVQAGPGSCIFISSVVGPTKLTQSAYWVMRLPYVYVTDKEHYPQNLGARLLKGVFGVSEVIE